MAPGAHRAAWVRSCGTGGVRESGHSARALRHLDGVLGTLALEASREIEFGCPCSASLYADEARLLQCLARMQRADVPADTFESVLHAGLAPAAEHAASAHALALAAELSSVGLQIPCPVPPHPSGLVLAQSAGGRLH